MQQKRRFWQALAGRLDIPQEALPGGFSLTLSGQAAVTVSGCRRILSYGDTCIRLEIGGNEVLAIHGKRLLCTVFRAERMTVEGQISGLCFEGGARANGD